MRMGSTDRPSGALAETARLAAARPHAGVAATAAGAAVLWHEVHPRRLLVVAEGEREAEAIANDLPLWLPSVPLVALPPWDTLPLERVRPSVGTVARRVRALSAIAAPPREGLVVVASVRSALTKLVSSAVGPERLRVRAGGRIGREEVLAWAARSGYLREAQVSAPGEVAARGSIIDVYDAGEPGPVRIDLFGDEVDRLTRVDPTSQRSVADLVEVTLYPAREVLLDGELAKLMADLAERVPALGPTVASILEGREPPEPLVPLVLGAAAPTALDLLAVGDCVLAPQEGLAELVAQRLVVEERSIKEALAPTWGVESEELEEVSIFAGAERLLSTRARVVRADATGEGARLAVSHRDVIGALGQIAKAHRRGDRVVVATHAPERARHVVARLTEEGIAATVPGAGDSVGVGLVEVRPELALVDSVHLAGAKLVVVADASLVRPAQAAPVARAESSATLSFDDLVEGGYVVHEAYGIARYRGLVRQLVDGIEREYLELEFANADRVFLPFEHLALIAPYVGSEEPRLTRLRGGDWQRQLHRARRQAQQIAQELVVLYQRRLASAGTSWRPDPALVAEFADRFPYELTPDQARAIQEVLDDLEKPVPMDRLVCGDVGFGKTEVALRAAFVVAAEGAQVLVLAPTTLLAAQHAETFQDRFAGLGLRVGHLSRLTPPKEAARVREGVARGEIDILVATHAALGRAVHFAKLGLLVIDEEQRFGVGHKEQLKEAFPSVDVLVLTATPIPRSLELSLVGIRDLSILRTAPVDRHPILTHVGPFDERVMVEAIRRELLREGQVFVVHNRVRDIEAAANRVSALVPEARVLVAHGQLSAAQLERTMTRFWHGEADVLVSTTIVENGIDLARVNTLIVDRAEHLGLAQLHQLRGRVGRSGRQAYAYLFTAPTGAVSDVALERLRTIAENTDLGAGYRIAMRDLELRGAGTILGMRQSGHVGEVGYELYVRLVAEEVARMDGVVPAEPEPEVSLDVPVSALLPEAYVAEAEARMDLYRRIARARGEDEFAAIADELRDRFGPLPAEAEALLALARLRRRLAALGATHAAVRRHPRTGRFELTVGPLVPSVAARVRLARRFPGIEERGGDLVVPLRTRAEALERVFAVLDATEGIVS
jgi:transcription-repair coupling factor (superfamily II helicase)